MNFWKLVKFRFPGLLNVAITFSGFEDNFVVIIPSKDLVVVRLGVTHSDGFDIAALFNDIMDLLQEPDNLVKW